MKTLLALTLALAWGQAVSPDVESVEQNRGYDSGGGASAKIITIGATANPMQGIEAGDGAAIPTTAGMLRISVVDPNRAAAPRQAPPDPQTGKWFAVAVFVGAGLLLLGEILKKVLSGRAAVIAPAASAGGGAAEPSTAGQFAIVRKLGEGGMGVVYEALDRTLDRKVAIKKMREELRTGPQLEEFLREAKTVAGLHHPNIVDIHSIVSQAGELYLVFEHVDGQTLSELLRARGRLSIEEAKALLKPVCDALEFAHARRVVHRDLKPANVMITRDGLIKVMDFGIARRLGEGSSAPSSAPGVAADAALTDMVRGTLSYMAPEAFYGQLSPRSDVYALGVMAYELIAGRPPYVPTQDPAPKVEKRYERLSAMGLGTPALSTLVERALEPNPEARIGTAAEFRAALLAA